jgi:predicted transcriptional regulator/DNA-binding XRE family transcriptional regulator
MRPKDSSPLGTKVRAIRRQRQLTQAELAQRLGISAAYLNLIENDKRPLTAPMLLRLAELLELDVGAFASSGDTRLVAELLEAFGDPLFDSHGLTNVDVRDLATQSPNLARAVLTLYRGYRTARAQAESLAEAALGEGKSIVAPPPSEEVSDFIQRHDNYFPEIEAAAEELWQKARLTEESVFGALSRYLEREQHIDVRVVKVADERKAMRRFDPETRVISLSEILPPRTRRFQLAHQVGLLTQSELFDRLTQDELLTTTESRALGRVALANYFASAILMPYRPFVDAAKAERYDIELLAHRFRASFEQVCHRLTTLRRPGFDGVPFHFIRIDVAGNISKRFSGSGMRIPRYGGCCPRWNVHDAFHTPGMIRVQLEQMPDGKTFFCIARTVRSDRGGYHAPHTMHAINIGCEARYAKELVYADGVDLDEPGAVVPVGVTCRICERTDCEQRVFPPVNQPLRIDENVRGLSFYSPSGG